MKLTDEKLNWLVEEVKCATGWAQHEGAFDDKEMIDVDNAIEAVVAELRELREVAREHLHDLRCSYNCCYNCHRAEDCDMGSAIRFRALREKLEAK